MDWLKIAAAIVLVAMFFYILPSAKAMVKNAPKGNAKDWMSFALPMIIIALFIALLVSLV
jgi:hypothetical protein